MIGNRDTRTGERANSFGIGLAAADRCRAEGDRRCAGPGGGRAGGAAGPAEHCPCPSKTADWSNSTAAYVGTDSIAAGDSSRDVGWRVGFVVGIIFSDQRMCYIINLYKHEFEHSTIINVIVNKRKSTFHKKV